MIEMTEPAKPASQPQRSTLYIVTSACLAAIILGFVLFLLIRGFQWRGAMADLRAEPGIEILSVERVGFFKKRLRGLRDPLAPTAESYLRKHHIGDHAADVVLTEYHSLNTPYALERSQNRDEEIKAIRDDLVRTIGQFAEELKGKREADLEKITQMLFEARFPEAMKTVDLRWEKGAWYAEGELYAPDREKFVADSPQYIIEGDLNFSGLVDLTETRTAALRKDIESANLLETDLDGNLVHLDRVRRLVLDLDEVCKRSAMPAPILQLSVSNADLEAQDQILEGLASDGLESARFLPAVEVIDSSEELEAAYLTLVQLSGS